MKEATPSPAESSWLLWSLGATVAWLAAYVALGWVEMAQRASGLRQRCDAVVLAAATLGTGLCSAAVISLGAAALAFSLGYDAWSASALWAAAIAGSSVVVCWPAISQRWWALLGSGTLLALLAAAVQAGWILAAGLRPGVVWQAELVAAAVILMIVGCSASLWLAFFGFGQDGRHRMPWRLGASGLLGLSLTAGLQLMMAAGRLEAQIGSKHLHEVPGTVLSLFCGVLVPMVLAAMGIDLELRREARRRSNSKFVPHGRRRRHHRAPGS
jgi:NO-binding membrane sensor protein with MHYT domain